MPHDGEKEALSSEGLVATIDDVRRLPHGRLRRWGSGSGSDWAEKGRGPGPS